MKTARDKERCIISVSNEGDPIGEDDRQNLFKKFYRGSGARLIKPTGSGLGLYIAKKNIETLGGKIWFDSPNKSGRGVTFYISLPAI